MGEGSSGERRRESSLTSCQPMLRRIHVSRILPGVLFSGAALTGIASGRHCTYQPLAALRTRRSEGCMGTCEPLTGVRAVRQGDLGVASKDRHPFETRSARSTEPRGGQIGASETCGLSEVVGGGPVYREPGITGGGPFSIARTATAVVQVDRSGGWLSQATTRAGVPRG